MVAGSREALVKEVVISEGFCGPLPLCVPGGWCGFGNCLCFLNEHVEMVKPRHMLNTTKGI